MADAAHTIYIAVSYAFVAIAITGLIGHIVWRDHTTKSKLNALSDGIADNIIDDLDGDADVDVDGL